MTCFFGGALREDVLLVTTHTITSNQSVFFLCSPHLTHSDRVLPIVSLILLATNIRHLVN